MRTLIVLLLILGRFVGDIYTSAGIDRHIRDRQGIGIRDEQGADAVVVDGQFLNPFPVDLLGLIDLNVIDQLIHHPGCQLLRPCVFSHSGKKHIRGNRFAAELVQLFAEPGDRLLGRENVVDASNSLTPTAIRNLRTFCEIGKWGICNQRQLWIAVNVENTQILLDKQFRMIII